MDERYKITAGIISKNVREFSVFNFIVAFLDHFVFIPHSFINFIRPK